jgi:hypothetical protein
MADQDYQGPQPIDRPRQIAELTPDQMVAALLRLTMEISVLRDRLASHEALLAEHGLLSTESIDAFQPNAEDRERRTQARLKLIDSLMKDLS